MFRKGKSADLSRQDSGQSGASGRLEVDHDHSKVYSGYLWAPSRSPSQSESINSLVLFGMTYCNDAPVSLSIPLPTCACSFQRRSSDSLDEKIFPFRVRPRDKGEEGEGVCMAQ